MPRRQFDPSEHVEYMPPEFTREQKMMYPEEDDDYYDDEGLPVRLSDDIIMRAHYLDLGMSRLLQKYREGSLSDQEYIQFHRMNGELRSILQHVWNIGKRSLALWVQGHLRGGNPAYDIGIQNVEQLIDTFRSLDLPARPALTVMEQAMGYDMEDDLKRYAIGAPPLWGDYEYEDPEEQEQFDQERLLRRTVSRARTSTPCGPPGSGGPLRFPAEFVGTRMPGDAGRWSTTCVIR